MGRATSPSSANETPYQQFPPCEDPHHDYVYLAPAPRASSRWKWISLSTFLFLLLLVIAAFFLWPRQADVHVSRLHLGGFHVDVKRNDSILPKILLTVTLQLRIRLSNPNFIGVHYKSILVRIAYDGDPIGDVESASGTVPARATAYVPATMELNGFQVASNIVSLLKDLANRELPFQTHTQFDGFITFLVFNIPMQVNASCSFVVDPEEQVILSQDCDIEGLDMDERL